MKCKINNCERKFYAKNYCIRHYTRKYICHWKDSDMDKPIRAVEDFSQSEKENMIKLHREGMSTAKIAELFGRKKNSILVHLRNLGLLKKNTGYETEQMVKDWFSKNKTKAEHMRGDYPYDFLVNKEKIDVKGSHIGKDGYYTFEVFHSKSIHRKTSNDVDCLLLVFLSEDRIPMYKLDFEEVEHLASPLRLKNINNTKYNLRFYGFLG